MFGLCRQLSVFVVHDVNGDVWLFEMVACSLQLHAEVLSGFHLKLFPSELKMSTWLKNLPGLWLVSLFLAEVVDGLTKFFCGEVEKQLFFFLPSTLHIQRSLNIQPIRERKILDLVVMGLMSDLRAHVTARPCQRWNINRYNKTASLGHAHTHARTHTRTYHVYLMLILLPYPILFSPPPSPGPAYMQQLQSSLKSARCIVCTSDPDAPTRH